MKLSLPYPEKVLWPNGRTAHWAVKARATKRARQNAAWLAISEGAKSLSLPVEIVITFYPKPTGAVPDLDNILASTKSIIDGIADAMGVNDRDFPLPKLVISPERSGRMEIEVTAA